MSVWLVFLSALTQFTFGLLLEEIPQRVQLMVQRQSYIREATINVFKKNNPNNCSRELAKEEDSHNCTQILKICGARLNPLL